MSNTKNHGMKFKGTPGPWHVSFHGSANCWVVDSERDKAIAKVTKYNNDWQMQKANFQLLAAAPELLEALQAVVRVADRKTDEFEMAHSAINKALGVILMNVIKEIPVMRDEYGCWTHPEYEKFCGGREYISTEEFNAWMEENNLQYVLCFRDEGCADLDACDADISAWEPERPEGDGWFIGSIHDTEDGPVCVWLRNKAEA